MLEIRSYRAAQHCKFELKPICTREILGSEINYITLPYIRTPLICTYMNNFADFKIDHSTILVTVHFTDVSRHSFKNKMVGTHIQEIKTFQF